MYIRLFIFLIATFVSCSTPSPVRLVSNEKTPKNVILMIGDGMGLSQISGALYSSRRGLELERFQVIGLQKTSCKDNLVTDSAAAAAAMARGIKAAKNTFGTDSKIKAPPSVLEEMKKRGWSAGIVVTSSLTHATPAAFVTYQHQRSMYEEIAKDFLDIEVDFMVGGGKEYFDRRSNDERNLIEELKQKDAIVKSYLDGDLMDMNISPQKRFIYFSADGEPLSRSAGRTYFLPACERGIIFLERRSEKGFFFLIEGSQIDWGGHANVDEMVVDETIEFDEVVGKMLDFAKKDGETLVIVTADHETGGFSITGENDKGKPIVEFISKDHTGTMIPVFAYGPGSEKFSGIYENTKIHDKILEALRINVAAE